MQQFCWHTGKSQQTGKFEFPTPRPFHWVALCAYGPASEEFILVADEIRQ